jgi:hypothetical protein
MDGMASGIERDASGRFVPGQSGNPAGKLPGTRNRRTVLMEALREGEGEAVARVVIDKALSGDAVAARFCLGMISPRPRGRTIHLDLAADDSCNVVAAFNATLRALADGEITPDEAVKVARFLDGRRRRVLQAWQLEEKLTSYGRNIPGDPPSLSDAAEDDDTEEYEDEEEAEEDDDEAEPEDASGEAPVTLADAPPRPAAPAAPAADAMPLPEPSPAPQEAPVAAGEASSPSCLPEAGPAPQPEATPLQNTSYAESRVKVVCEFPSGLSSAW